MHARTHAHLRAKRLARGHIEVVHKHNEVLAGGRAKAVPPLLLQLGLYAGLRSLAARARAEVQHDRRIGQWPIRCRGGGGG
eukprot:13998-Chlamydomonas_euryale.AAC.1